MGAGSQESGEGGCERLKINVGDVIEGDLRKEERKRRAKLGRDSRAEGEMKQREKKEGILAGLNE